ncbi:uncharacterized protein LOC135097563 [Scylla paramamosain]|uniref:uncharacterized protein LOC135097563 n=1 Tax=Scylla paramamosain TaxID=85552 RepID=UPI0030828DEE
MRLPYLSMPMGIGSGSPPEQSGFRLHRNTHDVFVQIVNHITDIYRHRQVMTSLFLDLEGPFGTAPRKGFLYKMTKKGITGTTFTWIKSFFSDRSFGFNHLYPSTHKEMRPSGILHQPTLQHTPLLLPHPFQF